MHLTWALGWMFWHECAQKVFSYGWMFLYGCKQLPHGWITCTCACPRMQGFISTSTNTCIQYMINLNPYLSKGHKECNRLFLLIWRVWIIIFSCNWWYWYTFIHVIDNIDNDLRLMKLCVYQIIDQNAIGMNYMDELWHR